MLGVAELLQLGLSGHEYSATSSPEPLQVRLASIPSESCGYCGVSVRKKNPHGVAVGIVIGGLGVGLLDHYLNATITYLHDGYIARGEGGRDGGCATNGCCGA